MQVARLLNNLLCPEILELVTLVEETVWVMTGLALYKDGKIVYLRTSISSFRD